jgi:DNA-binding transcriptional ArsR family regulator
VNRCEKLLDIAWVIRHILNHMVQYHTQLDDGFAALSDATRRGILERLGRGDASISDLAARFEMTLTGVKKHVRVLEDAGFVTTEKLGRVRTCRLGSRRLEDETAWMTNYRQMLEARLERLGQFLARTKGEE